MIGVTLVAIANLVTLALSYGLLRAGWRLKS